MTVAGDVTVREMMTTGDKAIVTRFCRIKSHGRPEFEHYLGFCEVGPGHDSVVEEHDLSLLARCNASFPYFLHVHQIHSSYLLSFIGTLYSYHRTYSPSFSPSRIMSHKTLNMVLKFISHIFRRNLLASSFTMNSSSTKSGMM